MRPEPVLHGPYMCSCSKEVFHLPHDQQRIENFEPRVIYCHIITTHGDNFLTHRTQHKVRLHENG